MLRQDPTLAWVRPRATVQEPRAQPVFDPTPATSSARLAGPPLPAQCPDRRDGRPWRRLAGGAALPLVEAPVAAAAVPANAVSELDEKGRVVASVEVGTNPTAVVAGQVARSGSLNAGDNTVSADQHVDARRRADDRGRAGPARPGRDRRRPVGHELRRPDRDPHQRRRQRSGGRRSTSGPARRDRRRPGRALGGQQRRQHHPADRHRHRGSPARPIHVDDGPDGLAVDETSVWVAHGRSGTVLQIDAETGTRCRHPSRSAAGRAASSAPATTSGWPTSSPRASPASTSTPGARTRSTSATGPTDLAVLGDDVWVAEKYTGTSSGSTASPPTSSGSTSAPPCNGLTVADGRLWVVSGAFASTSHLGGDLRIAIAVNRLRPELSAAFDPAASTTPGAIQASRDRLRRPGRPATTRAPTPRSWSRTSPISVPEPTDGDRTYIFNLRPGIRYSDRHRGPASDFVLRCAARAARPRARPGLLRGHRRGRACIDAPDDLRPERRGVVADDAAGPGDLPPRRPGPAVPLQADDVRRPDAARHPSGTAQLAPAGTGPYRIAPATRDSVLTLTRNPCVRPVVDPRPAGRLPRHASPGGPCANAGTRRGRRGARSSGPRRRHRPGEGAPRR